jgi:hypothetical protein
MMNLASSRCLSSKSIGKRGISSADAAKTVRRGVGSMQKELMRFHISMPEKSPLYADGVKRRRQSIGCPFRNIGLNRQRKRSSKLY